MASNYSIRSVRIRLFLLIALSVATATTIGHAETIEWVGNQTGPFSLPHDVDLWSFYEGAYWGGWRVPGIADPDHPGFDDVALLGTQYDPPGVTGPYSMYDGGTLYFGDFAHGTNSSIDPVAEYYARDLVNKGLEVQSGAWTFDFRPFERFADQEIPFVPINYGSYTLTDYMRVGSTVKNPGTAGEATLTVRNGTLTAGFVSIAAVPNSSGSVTITGKGGLPSVIDDARLVVGPAPTPTPCVLCPLTTTGPHDLHVGDWGRGTLRIEGGAVVDVEGISEIGTNPGSNGTAVVSGIGSVWRGLSVVGHDGDGSLLVTGGGYVSSKNRDAFIGVGNGAVGRVTVRGTGSSWTEIDFLTVGGVYHTDSTARGYLTVSNGGLVESNVAIVGNRASSRGEVSISGGAQWRAGLILIGDDGQGKVRLLSQSRIVTGGDGAIIGHTSNGVGTVSMNDGAWENAGPLVIGAFGQGTLNANGSSITSSYGRIGAEAGSRGDAKLIGGAGWKLTEDLTVGDAGKGTLKVYSTAVDVPSNRSVWIGPDVRGEGEVVVGARGRISAGFANVGSNSGGSGGSGKLYAEHYGEFRIAHRLAVRDNGIVDVRNNGIVNVGLGELPSPGTVRVGPEGTLSGTGTILGEILVDGGTVEPGASPGTLHIDGNFRQLPDGVLHLEIGGTTPGTEYDRIVSTGDLLLDGTVKLEFIRGFVPRAGNTFDLFRADGNLALLNVPIFLNAPPAFTFRTSLTNGVFSVIVVPEPGTACLSGLLINLASFCPLRRRRMPVYNGNRFAAAQDADGVASTRLVQPK